MIKPHAYALLRSGTVVFGCAEHVGKSGTEAMTAALGCPSCMLLPRGEDGD
jgi:hypothetical protein